MTTIQLRRTLAIGTAFAVMVALSGQAAAAEPDAPSTAACFPFPSHDPAKPQHPTVTIKPGVPPLSQKAKSLIHLYYTVEWPRIWQNFGDPDKLNDPGHGFSKIFISTEGTYWGGGTLNLNYADLEKAAADGRDTGSWTHEHGHGTQTYSGTPKIIAEGIPDFIRFVAHGEDPNWKIVALSTTNPTYFDAQTVWNEGYVRGARFLLWLTMRYDNSGDRYQLVHDLNTAANHGERDFEGWFARRLGKSYQQLFREYVAQKTINPHC